MATRGAKSFFAAAAACALLGFHAECLAEEELAPGYGACIGRASGSSAGMLQCGSEAFAYWDKKLNASYKKAMDRCPDESCRKNLKDAERAFVKYKEGMQDMVLRQDNGFDVRLESQLFGIEATRRQARLLEYIAAYGE